MEVSKKLTASSLSGFLLDLVVKIFDRITSAETLIYRMSNEELLKVNNNNKPWSSFCFTINFKQ
jgi:hypothetical protein